MTTNGKRESAQEENNSAPQGHAQLVEKQKVDAALVTNRRELLEGKQGPVRGGCVVDDELLWATSTEEPPRLAIPRALVTGILLLAHGTYAHSGVGRTTGHVNQRFYWQPLA